jgi:hypothetical protein
MHGPDILVRSLNKPSIEDQYGNLWRYHSRSDRHSKVACWGLLFDLLNTCQLLRAHAESRSVVFGINHRMVDFKQNRKKDLDLVICTPAAVDEKQTFADLAAKYDIVLTPKERAKLEALPDLHCGTVGAVHLALEAKACMTAHTRALPRLYDELNSSHLTIHGSSDLAIAAGLVMVNLAESFVSPGLNKHRLSRTSTVVTRHRQPAEAEKTVAKAKEIPRRSKTGTEGFDALAIIVVNCVNDATETMLVGSPPAPSPGDIFHYQMAVQRIAQLYEGRFPRA